MLSYDIINGEQEGAFTKQEYCQDSPAGFLYKRHGNLTHYKNGDCIPYRSLSYNYTKDFIILDSTPAQEEAVFTAHIIRDGKLEKTLYSNDLPSDFEEDLQKANYIIDKYGICLKNIKNIIDVLNFISDFKKYRKYIQKIRKEEYELYKQWDKGMLELGSLEKGSDEYRQKEVKLDILKNAKHKLMEVNNHSVEKIKGDFSAKWDLNDSEHKEMSTFGAWLEAGIKLLNILENDKEIFSGYRDDFLTLHGAKLSNNEFMDSYMKWAEVTDDEKISIKKLCSALNLDN